MMKTGSLLLISILAVALLAPPAGSQSRKLTIEDVALDLIKLQSVLGDMQRTADARNAEMKAALEQMNSRFSTIDSNLQKLTASLDAVKTADAKSAADLQEAKTTLSAVKLSLESLKGLDETLNSIQVGINGKGGLKEMIRDLQVTEVSSGPTDRQAYDSAYSLYSQGFYDDAIAEFKELINAYPKSTRAAKAQLHIGMSYSSLKKLDLAELAYDEAIQKYPESDVKCNALYKKGLILVALKKTAEARKELQSVVTDCPNTDEAAQAATELKKLPVAPRGRGGQ